MNNNQYQLTNSQMGVYLDCINDPSSTKYNIVFKINFGENIDSDKLYKSLNQVIASNKIFNITVANTENGVYMIEHNQQPCIVRKKVDNIDEEITKLNNHIFDLENGPLYNIILCEYNKQNIMLFSPHHIIFDGTSFRNFLDELFCIYQDKPYEKSEQDIFDQSIFEQQYYKSEEYKKTQQYFENKFCELEIQTGLPNDKNIPDNISGCKQILTECTDQDLSFDNITNFAKSNGITANTIFMSAYAYTLAKLAGDNKSLFTMAIHGRSKQNVKSIGMFVNTLPIYTEINENLNAIDFMQKVQADFREERQHEKINFDELAQKYNINSHFMYVYNVESYKDGQLGDIQVQISHIKPKDGISKFSIEIARNRNGNFVIETLYNKSAFLEDTILSLIEMYKQVIKSFIQNEKLCKINLVSSSQQAIINKLNDNLSPFNKTKTVVEMFEQQVKSHPDNDALVYENHKYTYGQLDTISTKIAKILVSKGIKAEKVVGVLVPRNEFITICSIGVLKSGGAYLPMDTTYPKDRLNFMLQDSEAQILITTHELASIIDSNFTGEIIYIEDIDSIAEPNVTLPKPKMKDLFIMLYTSGSTGKPKGVLLTHGNIAVLTEYTIGFLNLNVDSREAAYASYGFDANMGDTYPTLCSGGCLYIISENMRLDLEALYDYFNENKITHTIMTTQIGRTFMINMMNKKKKTSLQYLSTGGEKLVPFEIHDTDCKFVNFYGPTECSLYVTGFIIDKYYEDNPIGKKNTHLKAYIVDTLGRMLPPNAIGELWIAGPQVARGYLNRPEKNAESFTKNPFCNQQYYDTVYHTGDLVKMQNDGTIMFVGRRDGQVKIRGFRIELSEVEEVIRRFNDIKDATVAAFDSPSGGKFIVAYIVSDKQIDIQKLNDFIISEKPPYMVPAITMQIDKIPFTQNQKVNKRALPIPQFSEKQRVFVEPTNEKEKILCEIFANVLKLDKVGATENFFDIGGTSIACVKVIAAAKQKGVNLDYKSILKNKSVQAIVANLSNEVAEYQHEVRESYPLTASQFGVYSDSMLDPHSTKYNIPFELHFDKKYGVELISNALNQIIEVHPAINSVITSNKDGETVIKPLTTKPNIKIKNGSETEYSEYKKTFVQPHNLHESLHKFTIFETSEKIHLLGDIHHSVFDGGSAFVFSQELSRVLNREKPLGEEVTIFDVAIREQKLKNSTIYNIAKEHFTKMLDDCQGVILPDPTIKKDGLKYCKTEINSTELSFEKVEAFCKQLGITENVFFLSVFGFILGKYTFSEDTCFTTVYNGRSDAQTQNLIGMLVKTLPVRCVFENNPSVTDYLKTMQSQVLSSMANDIYPFSEISRDFNIKANIFFIYQDKSPINDDENSLNLDTLKSELSINVFTDNIGYTFSVEYNGNHYSKEFISDFIKSFINTGNKFLTDKMTADICIADKAQLALIDKFNHTEIEINYRSVDKLFQKQVELHPDKIAIVATSEDGSCKEELSYSELNKRANKVANFLIKKGIVKDDIIGIVLDRTKEVHICEQGILKSGGAFLPMVFDYPSDRIDYCLVDAKSKFVITTEKIKANRTDLFSEDKPYKTLTVEEILATETNDSNPNLDIDINALAYCIYTSGSTGKPKGVMIEHRNLCNYADKKERNSFSYHLFNNVNVSLAVTSISFDVSILDNVVSLCFGSTVIMASQQEIYNYKNLAKLFSLYKIEELATTPSYISNLVEVPEMRESITKLKYIGVGGEAFPKNLVEKLKALNPELKIFNGYGPTETTVSCTYSILQIGKPITIGTPEANVKCYIVDKRGYILPPYCNGELVICGAGVGRGYINLPEKTAKSFYTLNGLKAYHSGDLTRYNFDGEIEFFGRIDNQIKLHGLRIELDEIENVILSYEGMKHAKVVVRNNGSEDFLAGFFTCDKFVDVQQLTEFMKSKLTAYMIPAVLMQLNEMPLTTNGKIDKKKLPEIKLQTKELTGREPKTQLEKNLCEIYAEVLKIKKCYADTNFFELGGTSLSAMKVVMKCMAKNISIVYKNIFDLKTPEALAKFIGNQDDNQTSGELVETIQNDNISELDKYLSEVLKYNQVKYLDDIKSGDIGDVFLCGATGFLGIHILKSLLEMNNHKIYALVRGKKTVTAVQRLQSMLMYYFGDTFEEYFDSRIIIVEGDITDSNLLETVKDIKFDTVFNCAAIVKHFSADDLLDRVNVEGVKNLINVCIALNKKLIQISTYSIAGENGGNLPENTILSENKLYMGQVLENKYVNTKYKGEKAILEAIKEKGLRAKIVRVGNLTSRQTDGEFQMNFDTNGFMNRLRAYVTIGKFPVRHLDDKIEFSPIDFTAKSIITLAGTPDKFTIFHSNNNHTVDMANIIQALQNEDIPMEIVSESEFTQSFAELVNDEKKNMAISSLVAYANGKSKMRKQIPADNTFTIKALYELGFAWPLTDEKYIRQAISALKTLNFFEI